MRTLLCARQARFAVILVPQEAFPRTSVSTITNHDRKICPQATFQTPQAEAHSNGDRCCFHSSAQDCDLVSGRTLHAGRREGSYALREAGKLHALYLGAELAKLKQSETLRDAAMHEGRGVKSRSPFKENRYATAICILSSRVPTILLTIDVRRLPWQEPQPRHPARPTAGRCAVKLVVRRTSQEYRR